MCWLSVVVVSAFEAVGSILVIAMLILPGATALLWTQRLFHMHLLAVGHSALSAVLGLHLAIWLDCNTAAAMVVMGAVLFGISWIISPTQGLVRRWVRLRHEPMEWPEAEDGVRQTVDGGQKTEDAGRRAEIPSH